MPPSTVDDALSVLLDPALEPIVELVLTSAGGVCEARAVDGAVRFTVERGPASEPARAMVLGVEGRNPLGDQATDRFTPLTDELANLHPDRTGNAYPFGYEMAAQVFDHPHAPDVVVLHTAAHHWADQGGHLGEHGSMGAVQARAPFVIGGRGVRARGCLDRAVRLVDVAPTVCALLGTAPLDGDGTYLAAQDGTAHHDLLDPSERPEVVVGFLIDGTNANVLYDAAARGEVPNIARLMGDGAIFAHGAVASLPTVTLANHTTVMTGRHPGHHGILHNAWYDRGRGEQVITNDAANWATSMRWLTPGTETIHHAVARTWPGAFTAAVNEPCDSGAPYSTFDLMRRGVRMRFPRSPEGLPFATERFVRPVKDYAWATLVDHHGMEQAVAIVEGRYLDTEYPLPRFLWVNLTLTDAAFHEGGPHSEIARASLQDTDARIGAVLDALDRRVGLERCAWYVVADHGMEESKPGVGGDWGDALRDAGLAFRDEAFGFVYLNP